MFNPPSSKPTSDERRFLRHAVRAEARLEPLDETHTTSIGQPANVSLQDIARTGVMFQIQFALPLGSKWRLVILQGAHRLAAQPIIVRHCLPIRHNLFSIGAEFMIEPVVLNLLGVPEHDLEADDLRTPSPFTNAAFIDPIA